MASESGGHITHIPLHGDHFGFYDLLGPDCGQVSVSIDGDASKIRPRFDGYCTYHRLSMLMVASDLENKPHTVTVTIHPDQPDKQKLLHSHRLPDLQQNPEKYDGTNWYLGGIMLIGEPE